MTPELERVAKVRVWREEIAAEWLAALRGAADSGSSHAEIGRAGGVSRQAVRQLLETRAQPDNTRLA